MRVLSRVRSSIDGVMHVTWCSGVDPSEDRGPCTIGYILEAPGSDPIQGKRIFDVASSQWPRAGQDLPVSFDPADPLRVTIHWHPVIDLRDAATPVAL